MNFKGHVIGSTIAAVGLTGVAVAVDTSLSTKDIALIVPMVILGGNFPDIDTESKPSRYYAIGMTITFAIFSFLGMYIHGLMPVIPFTAAKIFKHRGWTHSFKLVFALIFSSIIVELLSFVIPDNYSWLKEFILKFDIQIACFGIGITIHILLDHKIFKNIGR